MIKLKEILLPNKFKNINNPGELAKLLISVYNSNNTELDEDIKGNALKVLLPLLFSYYGATFVYDALSIIGKINPEIAKNIEIKTKKESDKSLVLKYVDMYSKKYNINANVITKMLEKESALHKSDKNYDAHLVGDKGNVLGPSYGAGQIKVAAADYIWSKIPESDINKSNITSEHLTDNIEFNIRTMCKLISYYYHDKFSNIKNSNKRYALAATAYNRGYSRVIKSLKPNSYGLYAVSMKKQ